MMPSAEMMLAAKLPDDYRFIEFHVKHLDQMSLSKHERRTINAYPDFERTITNYSELFPSFTLLRNGKIVAAYGMFMWWHGTWEVWVFKDLDYANMYPIEFTKISKNLIKFIGDMPEVQRLQISVRNDNPSAVAWAKTIGFEQEGLLRRYAPDGCDCVMFVRN